MYRTVRLSHGLVQGNLAQTLIKARFAATAAASAVQDVKDISAVPGPMTFPVFGSAISMLVNKNFDATRQIKYWSYLAETYGPICRLDIFGAKMVCLTDPDDIQKIFEVSKENPVRIAIESMKIVRKNAKDNFFEGKYGIFIEDGEEWWRVRKRAQVPMMKLKIVKGYLEAHNAIALEFTDKINDFQNKYGEMPEDFQNEMYKWALESVGLVALDRRLGCLDSNISEDSDAIKLIKNVHLMFQSANDAELGLRLYRFFETKSYKDLKQSTDNIIEIADKYIRQTVEQLKAKPGDNESTLMESLLQMPGLSYKDAVTMVLDMMLAGIDTTSYSMSFALYLLAKNPEKQKMLQQEIDEVFGDRKDITAQDLGNLVYTRAVVKETMRIFPIGLGNVRVLQEDFVVKGYRIPKGYGALMINVVTARQEKYFPKADEFIPERWLRSRPLGPIHPFASLPFGAGTRMCIGRRIAEQEMYTFLARIMQRFTVEYKYKDMDVKTDLIFSPSEPLKFNFIERK